MPARLPSPVPPSDYDSESESISLDRSRSGPRRARPPGGNWDVPEGQAAVAAPNASSALVAPAQQQLQQSSAPVAPGVASTAESGTSSTMPLALVTVPRTAVQGILAGGMGKAQTGAASAIRAGGRRQSNVGKNFCMRFLSGMCFEQGCSLRHAANAEEMREGIAKFDKPCKFGIKCLNVTCLYRHDVC